MSHFAERLWRPRKRNRPNPRLAVEPLEARLAPAIYLNFVPTPVVAVNPQPIPPQAVVRFIPEPAGSPSAPATGAPAGATPFHSQGHFRESVQGGWVLDAVYALDGQVTETEKAGPMGTDSVAVSYDYVAHFTEALMRPGAAGPVWLYDATQSTHGGASVEEIVVTKDNDMALVDASYHETTAAHETMMPLRGNPGPWSVDAAIASQGTLNGIESIGSGASGAGAGKHKVEAIDLESIHIDSVLAATLAPLDAAGKRGPAWHETALVVTKAVSKQQVAFAFPLPGDDLHGTSGLDTRLSVTLKPPTNPGDPPPPPEVFTSHVHGQEDFNSIILEGG